MCRNVVQDEMDFWSGAYFLALEMEYELEEAKEFATQALKDYQEQRSKIEVEYYGRTGGSHELNDSN